MAPRTPNFLWKFLIYIHKKLEISPKYILLASLLYQNLQIFSTLLSVVPRIIRKTFGPNKNTRKTYNISNLNKPNCLKNNKNNLYTIQNYQQIKQQSNLNKKDIQNNQKSEIIKHKSPIFTHLPLGVGLDSKSNFSIYTLHSCSTMVCWLSLHTFFFFLCIKLRLWNRWIIWAWWWTGITKSKCQ